MYSKYFKYISIIFNLLQFLKGLKSYFGKIKVKCIFKFTALNFISHSNYCLILQHLFIFFSFCLAIESSSVLNKSLNLSLDRDYFCFFLFSLHLV